ncbi:MAG: hypothetical protein MJ176_07420 [Treponema sp.]|nr:hypothetical protein [Treponema sp.]
MFDDKESDFWKEKLNQYQHMNMTRTGAERLSFQDVPLEIKNFENAHPGLGAKTTDNTSYITWELPVTSTVKLRVFFQSQIKVSLMQTAGGDPVKICDAKFPYNPFPEIEAFVKNIPDYKKDLDQLLKAHLQLSKKQKIAGEFIKAYIQSKISTEDYLWQLVPEKEAYLLKLTSTRTSEEKQIPLSLENFQSELSPYIP